MKTSELIDVLSSGAGPAPRAVAAQRLVPIAVLGIVLSGVVSVSTLGPAPASMLTGVALWAKLGYAGTLAAAAGWLTACLARPVSRIATASRVLVGTACVMALLGSFSLASTSGPQRVEHLLGDSWAVCPWRVLVLSLPALAGALWAVRGLAPTRPRLAGFAAGLFAGSLGALGYALACPEVSLTFIAVWYSLGIALSGAVGAFLGPQVLRW